MTFPYKTYDFCQNFQIFLIAGVEATLCGSPEQLEDFWKAQMIYPVVSEWRERLGVRAIHVPH